MSRSRALSVLLATGALAFAAPAAVTAQEKPAATRLTVNHYVDFEQVTDPQLSPDGSQILYTRRWINQMKDGWDSALWLMSSDGSRNRFLVEGSSARWSPDGTRIVYIAEQRSGGAQIFVRWMDAEGAVSQVTRVTEPPSNLRWSPDGRSIAFTMLVPRKDRWPIDMPAAPKGATWTEAPRLIETTHYRQDREGFMKDGFLHIFMVSAEGGTPRAITSGDWNVGARPVGIAGAPGIEWTPDGKEIVFDALREEPSVERYQESHIWAVKVADGEIRQITRERGPWNNPVVSPDGRLIAFTGYAWTPQTYKAEELYVIGLDGSGQRILSSLDRDPENLRWAPDGSGVYFTADDRGSSNIHLAALSGSVKAVTQGTHMLSLSSVARNGSAVGVLSAPDKPGDVVRMKLNGTVRPEQLTRVNEDVLSGKLLGEVEEIWYDSSGGTKVQGWLVKPPAFDPARKYPLILHIHGGPHAMYNVAFNYSFQNFAANGYLVLYTNPRGSTGYGTAFGNAIDDGYPGPDYDDLMAGVDRVVGRGFVDTSRMYVTGVSGGGVLSSWIIAHTSRFAAAAVRAPVTNWISFAGTTDITAWGYYRFRGHFWENPRKWLDHSPLMKVAEVKTPTLLMTGELDLRTPMGQTEEYYQALKTLKVPTAMLRFNGEYHGTGSKPSNFMRTQLYLMSWFGRYPERAKTGDTAGR
ncbi:MAG: S9 family peptidase [Candidatus Polarisedimenticolia bacterium]